jgi:hypothetical protein
VANIPPSIVHASSYVQRCLSHFAVRCIGVGAYLLAIRLCAPPCCGGTPIVFCNSFRLPGGAFIRFFGSCGSSIIAAKMYCFTYPGRVRLHKIARQGFRTWQQVHGFRKEVQKNVFRGILLARCGPGRFLALLQPHRRLQLGTFARRPFQQGPEPGR